MAQKMQRTKPALIGSRYWIKPEQLDEKILNQNEV